MKRTAILALSLLALASVAASAQANAGPGTVTISYNLFHPHWIASNQLAVWSEDAHGAFVKTIFATDFMARRKGYIKRPQSCPEWVIASDLAHLRTAVYTYNVEGNISWEKRILWEGKVQVGSTPATSVAVPTYVPDSARTAGTLLTDVGAKFQPSH